MLVSDECPVEDCNCLACVMARGYTVNKGSKYVSVDNYPYRVPIDWTYLWGKYSIPYTTPDYGEKAEKDFSGIYRFNYSIVDEYGHGGEYSIVLDVQTHPVDEFQAFMRLVANNVRWHLIEYFMVRWENGEYVKV